MSDNRAPTYLEDDLRIYRASSFGMCQQFLTRIALGQTPDAPPEKMIAAMEVSAGHEGDVLAALEGRGYRLLGHDECGEYGKVNPRNGQIGCELKVPGGVIRCHPDAIVETVNETSAPTSHLVVEVKTLSEKTTGDPLKGLTYAWQVSIEMASTGLKGLFVVAYKDEDGGLVYENPGKGEEPRIKLDIQYLERPPFSKAKIVARAVQLGKLFREAEEGNGLPLCDVKQWPCGFWREHSGGIWDTEYEELEAEVILQLDKLARDWKIAKNKGEQAEKDRKTASKAMQEILEGVGLEEGAKVKLPDYTLTLAGGKSTKYDQGLAEKDGVDLSKYRVETPYTYVLPKYVGSE